MWLFTTFGFFSAVQKPGTDHLTVRSRVAADLDQLRERYMPALSPTIAGGGTDYPFRATISHADFATGMTQAIEDLRHANFKNAVAAEQGHRRAHTYGKVWSALLELESGSGRWG